MYVANGPQKSKNHREHVSNRLESDCGSKLNVNAKEFSLERSKTAPQSIMTGTKSEWVFNDFKIANLQPEWHFHPKLQFGILWPLKFATLTLNVRNDRKMVYSTFDDRVQKKFYFPCFLSQNNCLRRLFIYFHNHFRNTPHRNGSAPPMLSRSRTFYTNSEYKPNGQKKNFDYKGYKNNFPLMKSVQEKKIQVIFWVFPRHSSVSMVKHTNMIKILFTVQPPRSKSTIQWT